MTATEPATEPGAGPIDDVLGAPMPYSPRYAYRSRPSSLRTRSTAPPGPNWRTNISYSPHGVERQPIPADGSTQGAADDGVYLPHAGRGERLAGMRAAAPDDALVRALDPVVDHRPAVATPAAAAQLAVKVLKDLRG